MRYRVPVRAEDPIYETKTKPTAVSVTSYLAGIEDAARRKDCKALVALMKRITGCSPRMWGPTIIGFDTYHYRYESGHEGDACVAGFASRQSELCLYVLSGRDAPDERALLAQLGKHRSGKACLYIKRLSDIELPVLERLITRSVAEVRRRYPSTSAKARAQRPISRK